ncbi:hypothetical protein [Promicromonospora sukumoe]|uniref:hypothetical protein n=1 Tax=Promicromonospora sukumoe TaxID=88382 RepID=UPI00039C1239|nr:hypothetical protein [Promicromonospora sukumoe]
MNPLRLSAASSRALALLTGGALLAGLITVPAIPAPAATAEPSPSATGPAPVLSTMINGEACGDDPVWYHGDGSYLVLRWSSTFDVPTADTAVLYTVVSPDGVDLDKAPAPVDDGVAVSRDRTLSVDDGTVYTLEVRLRDADGVWAEEPVASCVFGVRHPPVIRAVVPDLGADAVYVSGEARGGAGVAGRYLVADTYQHRGEAVAYEYALTTNSSRPTTWETVLVPDAGPASIPVLPMAPGSHYLHLRGIDQYGVAGPRWSKNLLVGAAGTSKPVPPAVTVADLAGEPGDGRIPLAVTLTSDLASKPMGEVVLRYGAVVLGRATFDAQTETVLVEPAPLGTGFRQITAEYQQLEGAPVLSTTARVCAKDCVFTGGWAVVESIESSGNAHPSYNSFYRAVVDGFSPTPASYTYQWLRDGAAIKGATSSQYLSSPADVGRSIAVRVTATGPSTSPRSVTSTPFTVRPRDTMHVSYGLSGVGSPWESNYCYCQASDGRSAGIAGSGWAAQALIARPYSESYATSPVPSTSTESRAAFWFESEGYVQGRGWVGSQARSNMYYLGSIGEKRRLEAIRISPGGPHASFYDVWYRVYVPKFGWLGWAKNGEAAGTTGYAYRIEDVQIRVLAKGKTPTATTTGNAPFYDKTTQNQAEVQPYLRPAGWKPIVRGGATAGYTSTSQRLNAVSIDVNGREYSGGVQVSAKVEGSGWRPYMGDDRVSGTYHRTNRTSAYRMRLTGEMAKQYDLYYRVHVAGTGWLGWARNNGRAGTESYKYRNTAVQVVLVKKGERPLMSAYGRAAYKG